MSFIDLSLGKNESNLVHVQTKRHFYGVRDKEKSIIQLRVSI